MERRFQPVTVEEPSETETVEILKGLRPYYENHHGVVIEDSAVEAAVKMAVRYINDRFLPDKAIDIIDEASSKVQLAGYQAPERLVALEKEVQHLTLEKEAALKRGDLEKAKEVQQLQERKRQTISEEKERANRRGKRKKLVVTEELCGGYCLGLDKDSQ